MLMKDELKAGIEALLFASPDRVSKEDLMHILHLGEEDLDALLAEMMAEYKEARRGIQVIAVEDGYMLGTKAEHAAIIEALLPQEKKRLSTAALETLAIIAYRQPITRAEIEHIRGVKTDRIVNNLAQRGLIKEVGQKDKPGKPILYGTTHEFLKVFNLNSLDDLPPLPEE